jgi:hypothetical protein
MKTNGAIVNAMHIICSSSINQFEYVTYLKLMLLCDIIVSFTKFKVGPTSKKKLQLNNSDLSINNIFLVHSLFPHHLLLLFIYEWYPEFKYTSKVKQSCPTTAMLVPMGRVHSSK